MRKIFILLSFFIAYSGISQQISLKKGTVIDNISVNDSLSEAFTLYLPTTFDMSKKWPVIFVFDMKGRGKQAVGMFRRAAEKEGYILAASNSIRDSLELGKNILITSRLFNKVQSLLPIEKSRSYTAGFDGGARIASLVPVFIKDIKGVISCGSAVANEDILSNKRIFHFIGVVGDSDYSYTDMLASQKVLNRLKLPNQLLVFEGGKEWPKWEYLAQAMQIFTLSAMAKSLVVKDQAKVTVAYQNNMKEIDALISSENQIFAAKKLSEMLPMYRDFGSVDSIKVKLKQLKKTKQYKNQSRNQNSIFFKENLIKDEFIYSLDEDLIAYNYNNLGWWQYQMEELEKYTKSGNKFENKMAARLRGYLDAVIKDNITVIQSIYPVDAEAITFLWMLNTITNPNKSEPFLKVISKSSKVEDYGTALFYLEELLKNGYSDKEALYGLEHTALLRITPEFQELAKKYLK